MFRRTVIPNDVGGHLVTLSAIHKFEGQAVVTFRGFSSYDPQRSAIADAFDKLALGARVEEAALRPTLPPMGCSPWGASLQFESGDANLLCF